MHIHSPKFEAKKTPLLRAEVPPEKRDFFSFCTSLKPLELKAIGELSTVEHIDAEVTIFSKGEPSDALYIINRGVVAVIHQGARPGDRSPITYLSRGDVFGEMGVLTDSPRSNEIRTCEPVSLQCFRKEGFPELVRRVPSFFHYLSQQLALRLIQVSDLAFIQSHCLELSGNLDNFDLVTIYQTILNSSQTGELVVTTEESDEEGRFFFRDGKPICGHYDGLVGEEAFWQLFLREDLAGTFHFSIVAPPEEEVIQEQSITRHQTDLLIQALQFRDEFKVWLEALPDPEVGLKRCRVNLDWEDPQAPDLQPLAEKIWELCYATPRTLRELLEVLPVSHVKVYRVVAGLMESGHFEAVSADSPDQ